MVYTTGTSHNQTEQATESMFGPRELSAEELRFSTKIDRKFSSTRELSGTKEFFGQERALAALELGLGVSGSGYNIFVSGLTGAEKLETLRDWLAQHAAKAPTPGDWVYVHNFKHPDAPRAIYLRSGQGNQLRQMMQDLVKTLREELPKAFRQEAFDKEKSLLTEKYNARAQELHAQLAALARERGFQVQVGSRGNIYFIPIVDGKPLQRPQDFANLSEPERQEVERRQQELSVEMERLTRKQQEIIREMEEDIRAVERRFCENLLVPILTRIETELKNDEIGEYLSEVKEHVLNSLDDFKEAPMPMMSFPFPTPVFAWAPFRSTKAAIKLHTLLDLRGNIPSFLHISDGKLHDVNVLDLLLPEPGAFYIMDRGYIDFERLYRLHKAKSFFVTRAKSNLKAQRRYSHPVDRNTGLICDQTIVLTGFYSRQDFDTPLRRVRFKDPTTGKRLVFLTNNFTLPAFTITELYRCRWQVELFFKWIKQHLRIKVFFGTSENAVKTQIWIAVSVYVLVAIVKKRLNLSASLYEMFQILSLTMFERIPLDQLLNKIIADDIQAFSPNQLHFFT